MASRLAGFGETGHETLEAGPELVGIEQPIYPTERVMARESMLQLEKAAPPCLGKEVHIHRRLAAAQRRT
jgi:hypothetical protein